MLRQLISFRIRTLQVIMAFLITLALITSCTDSHLETRPPKGNTNTLQKNPEPTQTQTIISSIPSTVTPLPTEVPREDLAAKEDEIPAEPSIASAQTLTFEPNYNPLTGEVVEDPDSLDRRPIAVKFSNSARVRPQRGLAKADIIYEHLTEGGITRFTAIYYSTEGIQVGSIRSGRLIDLEIPVMYDAAFAYSGSSHQIKMMISASRFFDRVVSPDFGHGGFYRDLNSAIGGRFEDSMFTDTRVIRETLQERGQDTRPRLLNTVQFSSELPGDGLPIKSVEVKYVATSAFWSFDQRSGEFLRWSDGIRHVDGSTNQQLSFDNVVIVQAEHFNTEIIEDSAGSPSIQIRLWGEGPVTIFRDGHQYDGIWRRDQPDHMLTFFKSSGEPISLRPGNSYYQIVPLDYKQIYIEPS